ncbi:hypothetical protein A11S_680 [Micavibrio aeruginosavorus EPB]|uniref:Uncharacterized protein n=1 Tax=Micavibrio aeruginosavorus EPB TaxID=349215 RepID=M4VWE7_9BACT|nr:hypothetical protein A11S_680 [Micavibrio aeruginosavorus EPB]
MYAGNIRPDCKEKLTPCKYSKKLNPALLLNNITDYCE